MSNCKSCSGGNELRNDGLISNGVSLSSISTNSPASVPAVTKASTPCGCKNASYEYKPTRKEDSCCKQGQVACLLTSQTFSVPACSNDTEINFETDISFLRPGFDLVLLPSVASDSPKLRLRVLRVINDKRILVRNLCGSNSFDTSILVGDTVSSNSCFAYTVPVSFSSISSTGDDCLIGTFYFPNVGNANAITVKDSSKYLTGSRVSLGGFVWRIKDRPTSTTLLLANDAPGNGSVANQSINGGCEGECTYIITIIDEPDVCTDEAVTQAVVIGCTGAGKKKLKAEKDCSVLVSRAGQHQFEQLFGGSTISGPHYIEYNHTNPCASKLVHSPDLLGQNCTTLKCCLNLTPANTSQVYEVEVADSSIFSVAGPNNIFTDASGREYTVLSILVAGTPGKIGLSPRFPVTTSITVTEDTKICVKDGCQPQPLLLWNFPCDPVNGAPVFCSNDGLRTLPPIIQSAGSSQSTLGTDVNIDPSGNHNRPEIIIPITNLGSCLRSLVTGTIVFNSSFRLANDGDWNHEMLVGFNVTPTTVSTSVPITTPSSGTSVRAGQQLVYHFTTFLPANTPVNLHIIPRVDTVSSSSNSTRWTNLDYKVNWTVHNTHI